MARVAGVPGSRVTIPARASRTTTPTGSSPRSTTWLSPARPTPISSPSTSAWLPRAQRPGAGPMTIFMSRMLRAERWLIALAVLLVWLSAIAQGQTSSPPSGAALVEALRQGGYVIYFRHARTDFSQKDVSLAGCERQRNLSDYG